MRSGISNDPAATLEALFDRFVGQYDQPSTKSKDDEAVWKPIRERLSDRRIADRLQTKTIMSSIDAVEFEHAWKNGSWHCFQPLSFDLASQDSIKDKAHRWTGQLVGLADTAEQFKPYFVVGRPSDKTLFKAYDSALAILELGPHKPVVYEENQAGELVDLIEDMVKASDH